MYQLICCGMLTLPQLEHLPDDHVAHGLELLLFGKWQALRHLLGVGAAHLLPHLVPQVIGGGYTLVLCQLIHDGVHHRLGLGRQVAVDLFALGVVQALRQLHHQLFQPLITDLAVFHLGDQLRHGALRVPPQSIPVLRFLFIDVDQILLEDPPTEGGLDLPDALFGEIALLGIG